MPPEETPAPRNRKRKLYDKAEPTTHPPPSSTIKRRKLENQQQQRNPSSFWDNLSQQWLIPRALREFDRRTVWPTPMPPNRTGKENINLVKLKRFARHGGPSLSSLRAYPEPETASRFPQTMSSSQSGSRKRARTEKESDTPSKTKRTSAYDKGFEQHLIDHGVYPDGYGGLRNARKPDNREEILARLAIPRASLSPTLFDSEAFLDFADKDRQASNEDKTMTDAFPIIAGNTDILTRKNLLFGNLEHLTNGTLVKAKPDSYDGILPAELRKEIRAELGSFIVPSTTTTAPCAPNFFTEGKGRDGSAAVCGLQALYDGALGARGLHRLRAYIDTETSYDNNAYTIVATYHGGAGALKLYTIHPTPSANPERESDYHMTQLNGWDMTGNLETFRQGASAFRNARDWAQEKRKELIAAANAKASNVESLGLDSSTHSLSRSTNENVQQISNTSMDELAQDDTHVIPSQRPPAGAQKNRQTGASSDRRVTRSLALVSEDLRDKNR